MRAVPLSSANASTSMICSRSVRHEFPRTQASTEQEGLRTVLAVPLMREDVPIGVIHDSPHGSSAF